MKKVTLIWRGSVTDFATDVAYLLTREQGEEFVAEMERFLRGQPGKLQGELSKACVRCGGTGILLDACGSCTSTCPDCRT